jgi:flagellar hook-associated protein 2
MAISSPGLGSNLDVTSIVSQLMAIERQPVNRLNVREASFQAQVSAYGNIRSALSSFQGTVDALASASRFQTRTASSSDTTIATASASSIAQSGTVNLDVIRIAQNQVLAATGQTSTTASIGSGASTEIRFEFGTITGGTLTNGQYTGASFSPDATALTGTVTIDASNNSLVGIKDAINGAGIGVKASIVGDGSANPFRLVLQSSTSGAAGSMKVSVTGDATLQALLANDPAGTQALTQTAAAQNAELTVNGLSVTSKSNALVDVVQGVTLNIVKAGTASIAIGRDTSAAQKGVQDFVKAYNDLNSLLVNASAANPASTAGQTGTSGPLNGDAAVRSIQARLRSVLGESLGEGFSLRTLSQVGITFQRNGSLALDAGKLSTAVTTDPDGLAALFATSGTATDSLISVRRQSAATRAGSYAVDITQLAKQGRLTGSAPANFTISSGVNDRLTLTIDGTSASVDIPAGTYTADALSAVVQSAVNGNATLSAAGRGVVVENNAGILSIVSKRFGSDSTVAIAGIGAADLLGSSPIASSGVDVAGTINGLTATGSGQVLTGADSSVTEGLEVEVTGGSTGPRGSVTVGKGFASRISDVVEGFLSSTGPLASRTAGINRSIDDISRQRETLERRLTGVQARYLAQFTALDVMLSGMRQTSSFLTQQLETLNSA